MVFIKRTIIPYLCLATLLCVVSPAYADEKYHVLVNAENKSDLDNKAVTLLLRRLYLKQQTAWPGGETSIFFARNGASEEEIAFRTEILSMSDTQLDDHWVKMKQIRGLTPPRAVSSTRILLRQLRSREAAVGVVSEGDYLKHAFDDPDIEVLTTFTVMTHDK